MKHKNEIKRWADCNEGTKVWHQHRSGMTWSLSTIPNWYEGCNYIVDDEWAELRKAQADGKQLQYKEDLDLWKDTTFTNEDTNTLLGRWRIKTDEPEYEYQWVIKNSIGRFDITTKFGTVNDKPFINDAWTYVELYLPSKRERK